MKQKIFQMTLKQHTNCALAGLRARVGTELLQLQRPPAACNPWRNQEAGWGPDVAAGGPAAGSKRQMQS